MIKLLIFNLYISLTVLVVHCKVWQNKTLENKIEYVSKCGSPSKLMNVCRLRKNLCVYSF